MQLQEILNEKEQRRKVIEVMQAIQRLRENSDYQLIFEKLFFIEDCARFVHLSADVRASESVKADSLAKAQSAGHVAEWLDMKIAMGKRAEAELYQLDNNPAEYLGEDLEV